MALDLAPLHPRFVAESGPIALRGVDDTAVLDAIRDAMDAYAVVVFRDQAFSSSTTTGPPCTARARSTTAPTVASCGG